MSATTTAPTGGERPAAARPGPRAGRIGLPVRHGGERKMTELTIDTARRAFFTPETLASYLQVSDRMIRKWVAEGRLHSYKLDGCRRFDPADVDRFVSQFRDRRAVAA